jgi:Helix-turn-helix domain
MSSEIPEPAQPAQPAPSARPRSSDAGEPSDAAEPSGAAWPSQSRAITDPTVMRALAHPVRMALVELLGALGTVTATQASELLGESPANCAFHLRTLAKYGFVQEAGGGRGRERPWKAADLRISVSSEQADPQAALAASSLNRLWFEQWVERVRPMFGAPAALPGWQDATGWTRSAMILTPEESMELSKQIDALIRRYEPRKDDPSLRPPGALPVEWSIFSAPIAELAELTREQARQAAGDQAGPAEGN